MRKIYLLLFTGFSVFVTLNSNAQNVTVNPGAGSYADLTSAFIAINAGSHTGAITIDIVGNTTEPAAGAILNASGTGSASYTSILIRPSGGAARTISGAITAGFPLIDFNGADNVTVDGLNSGGNSLTISNTTVSATASTGTIRFQADASGNTITKCSVLGSATMAVGTNGGNISFASGVTTGNDNNTISFCDLGPAGANLPSKSIHFSGTSNTDPGSANSGIIINSNNIFDYFSATVSSAGIDLNSGTVGTTISNNKFYQTATRTMTTSSLTHSAIRISNSSGNAYQITGNTIGFASNTGTGTYTIVTTATSPIIPINLAVNTITATSVQGNTIAGIAISGASSGTSSSAAFRGIYVGAGLVTVGDVTGNTIGSLSTTGSITYTSNSTSTSDVIGIFNFGSNNWTTNNNNIGGITASNSSTGASNIYGLRCFTSSTANWIVQNNTIGGTVANSINSTSTATGTIVQGILNSSPAATITGNIIRNLTAAGGTGTTTTASVVGIVNNATSANHTIGQNTIFNLSNSNTTAATIVTGIQFNGSTANIVERNLIHSLTSATNSTTAEVNGIRVSGGTTIYRNNMIAIGAGIANAIGTAASNSNVSGVNGINEFLGTNNFFHNSVYIGGAPTAGAGASYAFNGSQTVNTRSFRDNIFFNARSNSGATGTNYAVKINGTTPNPTGLTINNNLYFANGTGASFGFFNSLNVANIAAWKTAVGQDAGSFESNPQFNDPTNAVPDLHLHPTNATIAESNGVDVGVTNDYDGQTRASLTPVDIGADAGNYNGIDLAPPVISYSLLGNTTSTTNRPLSATITDVKSGVPVSGIGLPVIYFRKGSSGAFASTQATSGGGSTYNFTIDYSMVTGGSVSVGDMIQYYVVAQDGAASPNVISNPSSGSSGYTANPPAAATPPAAPNSYLISLPIVGVKTVCPSGCDYTTLTGATGVFNAINTGVATGNIEIQIAGDLTVGEDGTNGLNPLAEQPAGSNFTVKIYPTGIARSITGSYNGALIRTNGSSRVTIDGSIGGTGSDRSLTIQNASVTTPGVVLLGSIGTTPVTNNSLKNCVIINGVNTSSAVVISDATIIGNAGYFSNITIQNNDIRKAYIGVFATGGTIPQNGSNLSFTQNTINSSATNAIRAVGLYIQGVNGAVVSQNIISNIDKTNDENDAGIWLASGSINASVTGNTVTGLGYTGANSFAPIGINITSGTAAANVDLNGNNISDISTSGSTTVRGISVSGTTADLTIQRNNVQQIINSNTGTYGSYGIDISGGNNIVVKNNFVSNVNHDMTGGAAFSTTFGVFGIRVGSGTGHKIYNNSVNLYGLMPGTPTSSLLSSAFAIVSTTSTGCDVRNNIFANNITGGTTGIAAVSAYLPSGGTSAMNLTWNNNAYFFGTDVARQGVGQAGTTAGTNFYTTLPLLSAYSNTLGLATNDNISQTTTGSVPYTTSTDLHLISTPGTNWCLNAAGANIPSVTDDYDGQVRNNPPDMGADEFTATGLVVNNPTAVCAPATIDLTAAAVTAGSMGGLTYSYFTDAAATIALGTPSAVAVSNTYYIKASNGTCSLVLPVVVTVNPKPTAFAVTGGGGYCTGGSGLTVWISGSETGVNYQLYVGASPVGAAVAGTGTAINFGFQTTAGTYTVVATNATTSCTNNMTGSVTVIINPLPTSFNVTGGGSYCAGGTGVSVSLSNSETGVNYQLYIGASPVGGVVAGTGSALSFGLQTTAGTYTVVATNATTTCTNNMSGSVVVTINPVPAISSAIIQPTNCVSANGAINITMSGAPGPYTYTWSTLDGSGLVAGAEDQTALTVGQYTLVVSAANSCTATATFNLPGPGGCSVCPTIGALTTNPISPVCFNSTVTLTASGLASMGITYGIEFKVSPIPLADPYTGGSTIATVPNSGLTGGGTTASTTTPASGIGSFYLYAILSPVPIDPACRPSALLNVVVNPNPVISIAPVGPVTICAGSNTTLTASGICTDYTFSGVLSGTQEVPPNASTATGFFSGSYNTVSNQLTLNLTFSGMTANVTAGHIHNAGPGVNGPVIIPFTGLPTGVTSGTYSNTFTVPPANVAALLAGNTYINIHTTAFPGGEIRSQLVMNPCSPINSYLWSTTETTPSISVTAANTYTVTATDGNGCSGTASVVVNVNPIPTVNAVASQLLCNGTATTAVTFSGAVPGTVYNWTNDAASIGLAASGSGNIASFIATNITNAPVVATITVTPSYTNGGTTCTGTPITFTIRVNPTPNAVATPASQTICSGATITTIALTSAVSGTTFSWTRAGTLAITGIPISGSGDISGAITNTTNVPVTVTFIITPTANGCPGAPITASVLVNPTPNAIATPATQTICSAGTITTIALTGTVSGTTYNWTRDNTVSVTGIAASGSGNISGSLTNTTAAPVTVTFTITPTANGCPGTPITATVLVNPTPNAVATPSSQTVCTNSAITTIVLSGNVSGTTYNWTRDNAVAVTGLTSGSGNISGTLVNTTTVQQTVTFTITPTANGCPGTPITATVIINPTPTIVCPANIVVNSTPGVCGAAVTYPPATATGTPAPTITYSIASGSVFPVGLTTVTATATNACGSVSCTFTVRVNDVQPPVITCPANITVNTTAGACTAIVSYIVTVTDNCPGTTTALVSGLASGATFPMGTTTVTHRATDASGNAVTCSFTVTVNDGQLPVISAQPANRTVCTGTNATFSVTATNAVSYQWQSWNGSVWSNITGATGATLTLNNVTSSLSASSYRVLVNGLCTVVTSNQATLYINPLPTVSISASPLTALLPGQYTSINAITNPSGGVFVWYKNSLVIAGTGAVLGPLSVDDIGTYKTVYTDPNGCVNTSANLVISGQVSDNMWVYPNPNTGQFNVRYYNQSGETATLKVFDYLGQEVYSQILPQGRVYSNTVVNIPKAAAEVYIVKVVTSTGRELAAKRIVVYH